MWKPNYHCDGIFFLIVFYWLRLVFLDESRLFLVVASGGSSLVAACGILIIVASLVAEHRLSGMWASIAVGQHLNTP